MLRTPGLLTVPTASAALRDRRPSDRRRHAVLSLDVEVGHWHERPNVIVCIAERLAGQLHPRVCRELPVLAANPHPQEAPPRSARSASICDSATDRTRHCGRNTPNRAARTTAKASRRASGNRAGSAGGLPTVGVASDPIGRFRTIPRAASSAHCACINSAQSRKDSVDELPRDMCCRGGHGRQCPGQLESVTTSPLAMSDSRNSCASTRMRSEPASG